MSKQLISLLQKHNRITFFKSIKGDVPVFYATYKDDDGKIYIGCSKHSNLQMGLITSAAECLERKFFFNMYPDVTKNRNNNIGRSFIEKISYFENWQFNQKGFPYKFYSSNVHCNLIEMFDMNGKKVLLPNYDDYFLSWFRPSSSGCSVHHNEKEAFYSSFLECVERHVLLESWLYMNDKILYVKDYMIESLPLVVTNYMVYILPKYGLFTCLIKVSIDHGKSWFFTTDTSLDPLESIHNAGNGIRQKIDWIMAFDNESICFDENAPAFHRNFYYKNGDILFEQFLGHSEVVSVDEMANFVTLKPEESVSRIESFGYKVITKTTNLDEVEKLPLFFNHTRILGMMPGSFGPDVHLPLNRINSNNIYSCKYGYRRYHPFA